MGLSFDVTGVTSSELGKIRQSVLVTSMMMRRLSARRLSMPDYHRASRHHRADLSSLRSDSVTML